MNAAWWRFLPPIVRTRLDGRAGIQRIISNTSWLFADRVLRLGLGLVVMALVTRHLGPEQYGILNYAAALVGLVGALANLGLDSIVVRDLVRVPEMAGATLGTAFALKALGGCATMLTAVAIVSILRPGDHTALAIVGITATATLIQAFDTIDFWFQSQVRAKRVVYARSVSFFVASALRLVLIRLDAPLSAFAWATVVEVAVSATGLLVVYRGAGRQPLRWRIDSTVGRRLLAEGWPLVLSGLAIGVYMKIDTLMLGDMLGNGAAGIYGAAIRISEVWYFIPAALVATVSPAITAAKHADESLYYARITQLFRWLAGVAVAIALPMTFLSGPIVRILYGESYAAAAPVLAVHIWAAVFVFLGMGQGCWTVNEGLTRITVPRTLAGAAVNVALNIVLIPRYGPFGAAIATVVSYALSAVLLNYFDRRTKQIFRLQIDALFLKGLRARHR